MNSIASALTDMNADRQKELFVFFQKLEQQTDGWQIAIDQLTNNRANLDESAVFFYLKIIECYVKNRFEVDSEANKFVVKQYVYNYFVSKKYDHQAFVLNKFAAIVNAIFLIEYSSGKWNTFFQDFLAHCNDKESSGLFLRILDQINSDIGNREQALTMKETEKAALIKDQMRENAIGLIAQFWFNIISIYQNSEPELVSYCFTSMSKYVDWIDIKILTNDSRMIDLLNLLYHDKIKYGVLDFLYGILHKGMDPISKVTLIKQFNGLRCIIDLISDHTMKEKFESGYTIKVAKFFSKIGTELIDCFKKLQSSKSSYQNDEINLSVIFKEIEDQLAKLYSFLCNVDLSVSMEVYPFARDLIQLTKNLNKKSKNSEFTIPELSVNIIIRTLTLSLIGWFRYPIDYEFPTKLLDDDEDENQIDTYRKSCSILLDNLNSIDQEIFSHFLGMAIVDKPFEEKTLMKIEFNELENVLFFLKYTSEWLDNREFAKLKEYMRFLIDNSIVDHPHLSVKISYFELICKFQKLPKSSVALNDFMPQVLMSFLGENGVKSSSIHLRCKVSILFNRFINTGLKNSVNTADILSFFEEIIKSLTPIIKLDYYLSYKGKTYNEFNANEREVKANRDNHLLLSETISHLIMHNFQFTGEKKITLLRQIFLDTILENANESSSLLQNLVLNNDELMVDQVVFDNQKSICEDIAHLINLTVYSLNSINNIEMKKMNNAEPIFLEIFNHFVKLFSLSLNDECLNILQQSLCHFLHRLIACLEDSQILPLLPVLIQNVLLPRSHFTIETIQAIVSLINRFIIKYKQSRMFHDSFLPFLNQFFLPFVSYIFDLTNSGHLQNEEKLNLQKAYFSLIFTIVNYVPEVLKYLSIQVFEQILITILQGLEMNELTIQKNCLNTLKKLAENHERIANTNNNLANGNNLMPPDETNAAIFKCVYTAILIAMDLMVKIADQNQILNEVISFLLAVLEVRGRIEFTDFLSTDKFAIYGDKMNQLRDALCSKDLKTLKIIFKEIKQMHQK